MRHSFVSPGAVLETEIDPVNTPLVLVNPVAMKGLSKISFFPET